MTLVALQRSVSEVSDRKKIPPQIASSVLLANRHSCCVCQKPRVQLHHIDEDPSNNSPENLATLCLDHHDMASMQIGLTKKLRAEEIREYKQTWEKKCDQDIQSLARDRLSFYATSYKNPPRIRDLFLRLTASQRIDAANLLRKQLLEEDPHKRTDKGYDWQMVPRVNDLTLACIDALEAGELWPSCLPRTGGHELDPDYPVDLSPPDGMTAFHGFDLYCQLLVRALCAIHSSIALEQLRGFENPDDINFYSGTLVTFREVSSAVDLPYYTQWKDKPTCEIQFNRKVTDRCYRVILNLKTMYIFSTTSTLDLARSRVCGIGLLGGAKRGTVDGESEIEIFIKPLTIGVGGLGQSENGWYKYDEGQFESSDL